MGCSKPLFLATSGAEVRVLGTRLTLSIEEGETSLGVTEGEVVMKRLSDGKSVQVKGGYHADVSPDSILIPQPIEPAPDTWSADFEAGLPDGWQRGQWESDGLPNESQGGGQSVAKSGPRGTLLL